MNPALNELRHKIDDIDLKLLDLLNQRALCALEVASVKKQANIAKFYCPEREQAVLKRILENNHGPLEDKAVYHIFRQIMSLNLSLQQPLTVACLGPEGTYSEEAAYGQLGDFIELSLESSFSDITNRLLAEQVKLAVMPLYNSTTGVIAPVLDQLLKSDVYISEEHHLAIQHNLLVNDKTVEINKIYAHEQSLQQCKRWLKRNQTNVKCIAVASNGEAAIRAKNEVGAAAIASARCAEKLGLRIHAEHIMDALNNTTTFVVINKGKAEIKPNLSICYLWLNHHDDLNRVIELADTAGVDYWPCSKGVLVRLSEKNKHDRLSCTVKKVQDEVRSCRILGCA
ncbi:chorismate mutase [Piscirickettsia litoralis]|uniref:Bifunctional chorismate mutase/prephenate dehydratase n=1 Tax=Piscirickettsia litoralis TaxID=1891921 RepID=A0ABX3A4I1_9GAMM|nr:chorismate mutase [Piscirickettsia litoralis]ODN43771.1 chorismate mutase [Piscirickettsia litoralis]